MRRTTFIVPHMSLQANFINFILFYVFSVGTSYSQFHVIYYRNSKVPVPHELEDRYPHIWDTGMFCRVISSEMRDDEYVPWTGKNYSCNDSILIYGEGSVRGRGGAGKLRGGEVELMV